MAEDAKATPAVLGEVEVVTAPIEGTHGGRHMVSNLGTQAEVDSALRYSVQTEGTPAPDTAPTSPAAAPVPGAVPVTPDVVAPEKKVDDSRSVQGRIDRYVKQAHEADRRAVAAEQRTADLELQIATQHPPATPAAPAVEPIPAEFQTTGELGDYIARTVKAGVETGLAERDTRTRETQAEVAVTQVERTWEAQVTTAAAAHEDWSAVFTQAGAAESGTDAVLEVAKTFANGAQVLYDLAKSPKALTRMGQMTQLARERAFAVASDRVQREAEAGQADSAITTPSLDPASAAPAPSSDPTPAAPTPMNPVTPSAPSVAPTVLSEQSTRGDYKAWKVANGIKF